MKKVVVFFVLLAGIAACKENKKVSIQPISQQEFAKLNSKEIQLLDVRTPGETNQGVIDDAVIINLFDADFVAQVQSKLDAKKPLYIYCAAEGRSSQACTKLVLEGFNEVYYLKGGYKEWIKKQQR